MFLFTDKESGEVLNNPEADTFCLLLKHQESVRLGPKTTLDVPVCYAPGEDSAGRETSVLHESILTFTLRKLDEAPWTHRSNRASILQARNVFAVFSESFVTVCFCSLQCLS